MGSKLDNKQALAALDLSPSSFKTKLREFIIYGFGEKFIALCEKIVVRYSLIENTPFFDSQSFSWTADLEENWSTIRQELDALLAHVYELPNFQDISPDQGYSTSQDNLWKTYFLFGYGLKAEKNCQRCPETTRIIEKIPGLKTAFFSILLPGKHIPEHRGPYKGVIRCLLALKVPEPKEKCRIRVGNETRHWEEGKAMVFDDSFPHEAWNETKGIRVVLFMDIVRPMRFPGSLFNNLLLKLISISPFVQDAMKLQKEKWDPILEKVFAKK